MSRSMQSLKIMLGFINLLALIILSVEGSPVHPPFLAHSYVRLALSGRDQPMSTTASNDTVPFKNCPAEDYKIYGTVNSMTITPCQRSGPDDACTFIKGRNYTIELGFLSSRDADNPRSSIVAGDPKEGPYAYSGQSFAACKYTNCPIMANVQSTYVYHFQTLASSFNYLTFNVTQGFTGPSLFCAGTNIVFQES